MEPPAPKKPKPSSTQMAPILETESDIQNKKSKSTKPPILEQPTSDLVVALIIDELIKQIFDKRAESGKSPKMINIKIFYALSFYKSQNTFCWSKFFVSDQSLFRYCACPKLFVPDQKMICV